MAAARGVSALGPQAAPLASEMERDLTNSSAPGIKDAAYALAGIGLEGLNILSNAVNKALEPGQLTMQ